MTLTVESIKEMLKKITPDWKLERSEGSDICKIVVGNGRWRDFEHHLPENAEFIIASPTIVRYLLERLEEAEREKEEVNGHIEGLLRRLSDTQGQLDKWKGRAKAFHEGYLDKAFEVTALEIQKLDLQAHGVDKVTARVNESLKTKMLAACIERNEAREQVAELRSQLSEARAEIEQLRELSYAVLPNCLYDQLLISAAYTAFLKLLLQKEMSDG
jgi:hypothetical protein